MEIGLVQKIDIDTEMQQAYLDYAMSVIVARALPDARDGLKPVHRRILYAMHDMGIRPDSAYKKSARIVGEVLGKYHPHGDMAVYEAMARMAQDFSMRYRLVDGQGNFGSVDGDAPAAMRYTEARLADLATLMLADISKNTVDFDDNFDSTLKEPLVLPSVLPNLLVNGATGIAVGMATSIPPHNLGEVIDALHYMIAGWDKLDDITVDDLMRFVKGPDFPTGGIILHEEAGDGLISAYSTGRGRVTVQASAHLEEMERGRNRIIITELPYMTNKSSLIERIASLVREEKLEGIVDLRDESDRHGMRIVIELNKTADPEQVLKNLYKSTPMQTTFSIITLALVDGEPRMLSLKQCLRIFIEHRLEIIRRRSEYDLERARQRSHILEGLRIAINNLDEVVSLIRKSPDADTARERLIKRFKLSIIQAQAILEMPLRRLAALERKKIEDEYKEVQAFIKEMEGLLKSPKKMRQMVDLELLALKDSSGDRRRTHIVWLKEGQVKQSLLTSTDLKPEKIVWLSVTADGLITRSLDDGPIKTSGRDAPTWLVQANTRDTLYLVADNGEAAALPVLAVPEAETLSAGSPIHKVSSLKDTHRLATMFTLPPKDRRNKAEAEEPSRTDNFVITVTRQGMVKKSAIEELPGPSANTFILTKVNEGDRLGWLGITHGQDDILMVTKTGLAIRFNEGDVRPMGMVAAGVMGIKLSQFDEVVGMGLLTQSDQIFLIASDGSAKRVPADQFPRQGRYGQGIIAWKLPAASQLSGIVIGKDSQHITLFFAKSVAKSIRLDEAPLANRATRGRVIQELKTGDHIIGLCIPFEIGATATKGNVNKSRKITATKAAGTTAAVKKTVTKPVVSQTEKTIVGRPSPSKASAKPAASKPVHGQPAGKGTESKSTARKTTTTSAKTSGATSITPVSKAPQSRTATKTTETKLTSDQATSKATTKKTPVQPGSKPTQTTETDTIKKGAQKGTASSPKKH